MLARPTLGLRSSRDARAALLPQRSGCAPALRLCRLASAALAALTLAGCAAGNDEQGGGSGDPGSQQVESRTTKVEVVKGLGSGGAFDPQALYDRLAPGVVTITSVFGEGRRGILEGEGEGEAGQGSGFVLDSQGFVATNAHVVTTGTPRTRRAKEVFVGFSDGNRVPARIVGTDPFADVAVLKLDPRGLRLTPLAVGATRDVKVGAPVAAIGSPFGEEQSLSVGVISAIDRNIESLTQFQIGNAIQTDAAINPGNSGGPLLSEKGRVLGINAQIRSRSGGGEGVGFAIPADAVRRSIRELRASGRVRYGFLGVSAQPLFPQLARFLDLPVSSGALIAEVEDGSPADEAGLKGGTDKREFQGTPDVPTGGDVIVSVDGRKLTRTQDLADVIAGKNEGDEVKLEVIRKGDRRTVEVKLTRRPVEPPRRGAP
ncbi:MAG: trypsin-like peptidase domain-containing protein [Actinomycetota bacterium]|nr:trypsin-like peptidase domain-containing protein [Actinomycetota bacterium]